MGDAADDAFDAYIDSLSDDYDVDDDPPGRKNRSYQSGTGNFMWRIAGGQTISMWDMDEQHLRNSINICDRHANTGKKSQLQHVLKEKYQKTPDEDDDGYQDFLRRIGEIE